MRAADVPAATDRAVEHQFSGDRSAARDDGHKGPALPTEAGPSHSDLALRWLQPCREIKRVASFEYLEGCSVTPKSSRRRHDRGKETCRFRR